MDVNLSINKIFIYKMENIIRIVKEKFENVSPFSLVIKNFDNLDLNDPETLKKLMWSSYFLYFQNDYENANLFLDFLLTKHFDGNYDKWTWIEGGILLKLEMGGEQSSKDRILETLSHGGDEQKNNLKRKTFQRRLVGQLLNRDKIVSAVNSNDSNLELLYSVPFFKELLFIDFMGNNEKFTDEDIQNEKQKCKERIQDLIS